MVFAGDVAASTGSMHKQRCALLEMVHWLSGGVPRVVLLGEGGSDRGMFLRAEFAGCAEAV